ncbi:MAG: EFR1 family ferrodoxin [Clostridia bacterium]|nr:EFR1 family ferrodoxin [Clostridia bacterium]
MVLYFSATGNTKLIAEKLAELLEDEAVNLLTRIKGKDFSSLHSDRPFLICSPVYVSELPSFIADFLKRVSLTGCRDVYGILTNGGFSGIAGAQMRRIIKQKSMKFKGYAEFKLPSNHITNKSHAEIDDAEITKRIEASLNKAENVANGIKGGGCFKNRHIFLLEYLVTVPVAPMLCYFNQGTEGFRVKESCISCGKCKKLCPMNVIAMEDGKPVWNIKRCAHCMSCIQNCPVEAIEYKDVTEGRARYTASKHVNKNDAK